MGSVEEVTRLLSEWERFDSTGNDVTPILNNLAEIFEKETQAFFKQDPDPFDDRHPSRSQPDCTLGHILKSVFRHQRIVDEMIKVYSQRDNVELNTAVCRFLLDLLPGLEHIVFHEDNFVLKLFQWAEFAPNPLQSYATGLLAAAMEGPEIASSYREKNAYFVPLMLKRLFEISKIYLQTSCNCCDGYHHVFPVSKENNDEDGVIASYPKKASRKNSKRNKGIAKLARYNPLYSQKREKEKQSSLKISSVNESVVNESSNSTWTENMLGSYQVFPLTYAAQQRYILQYLTPMGEYQELIGHVLEESALTLTLRYIDLMQNPDVRLAFEALKYLASLLNHKKIALEFLNIGGLQLLLKVPRSSIAAAGVSFCLYYLGYLEEALEKICMSSHEIISNLVSYALWLLECSHDSSRCHATLFFGFAFRFKSLLLHFDQQDGLRKLFNVMSTLEIFVARDARPLSDDEIYGDRITTKHVCASLKRYFEAHLAVLVEEKRKKIDGSLSIGTRSPQNEIFTCEAVEKNIELLHDLSLIPLIYWKPVHEFLHLDGVNFLLELITTYIETGVSGRAETVKSALDVLKICSLVASTQIKLCDELKGRRFHNITGISILLQASNISELQINSADVQRSALITIINCVCPQKPSVDSGSHQSPKKKLTRQLKIYSNEDILNKVWKAVRIKNGIIVLINLLSIKLPLTEADSIRALACRALCGLARSQNVQQIISKLPLVTDGQLTDLMKEPVLQDKYNYHLQFCKYGLELLERVTGAPLSPGTEALDLSKLTKSEVVTKTKIVYHEHQLLQLISDHLTKTGFHQTVQCLQKEMEEKNIGTKSQMFCPIPPSLNGSVHRHLPWTFQHAENSAFRNNSSSPSVFCSVPFIPPPSVPLKIKKKVALQVCRSPRGRLQKPQMCSGSYNQSPALMKRQSSISSRPTINLDSIVTEYLRKQHSSCKNPVLACPPFDLFEPHKCPEPQNKINAPANCILRLQKREMSFENGGYQGAALNTKHIYSRFRLYRTYRDEDDRNDFTTCAFYNYIDDPVQKLLIGTERGRIQVVHGHSGKQILSKNCHLRGILHIQAKMETPIFITSDGGRIGNSCLWKFSENDIELLRIFHEINYLEYGKRSIDKLIATKHNGASLMDTNTHAEIQNFPTEDQGNYYTRNKATLDYFDELVLSDGLIFDVRSGKMVHKLDKFNSILNGVFHPNGREIISNSEIWDTRTFKLLRTVSGLDSCKVTFNDLGNVIYAVPYKDPESPANLNCFYTFDAHNYNIISTVDVKRPVYDIAADRNDRFVCTVEGINAMENMCRLYEVGRTKQAGDENGDESEDSSEEDDDDDEDDDSDDVEGQANEVQFDVDVDEDNDEEIDVNWLSTTSSDDDNETLFSLNTSVEDD